MTDKKYKQDNKGIKEATRIDLTNKIVEVCSKLLTNLELEVLIGVLINNKSFAEIADKRQLTSGRIKQVFEKGIKRLNAFLNTVDERIVKYKEVAEKYSEMENRILEYEKEKQENNKQKEVWDTFSPEIQKLLLTKVIDTTLSERVKNICTKGNLFGENIETIADLVKLNPKRLLKFRNCGKKSITEIEDFFNENNLNWGMLEA